jgi:phosphopantetheinyl transferase (holo-ACP synthase)
MAAKKALIELDSSLKLSEISIVNERSGYPAIENSNYCVSITHTNEIAASLVFPKEFSLGIDIEDIKRSENIKRIITESVPNTPEFLTAAWTLKESLSKALKCGFSKPTNVFELSALTKEDNFFVCLYKQHSDFQGIAVVHGPYLLAITYPKSLESTEMLSLMKKTSSGQV